MIAVGIPLVSLAFLNACVQSVQNHGHQFLSTWKLNALNLSAIGYGEHTSSIFPSICKSIVVYNKYKDYLSLSGTCKHGSFPHLAFLDLLRRQDSTVYSVMLPDLSFAGKMPYRLLQIPPCPNEPLDISTPGICFISGCPCKI